MALLLAAIVPAEGLLARVGAEDLAIPRSEADNPLCRVPEPLKVASSRWDGISGWHRNWRLDASRWRLPTQSTAGQPIPGPLPKDPQRWVCRDSLAGATQAEIEAWCAANPDRGQPLPDDLRFPSPLSDLDAKNAYDERLATFLKLERYKTDLGWVGDASWRFTGPIVGEIGNNQHSFGTHLPVRVYYSPEVVDWLCDGRKGELPDGAAIVKEMHLITDRLDVELDDGSCMNITGTIVPEAWTVMVKRHDQSFDGWYWLAPALELPRVPGNLIDPPVFDRSAITRPDFYENGLEPVTPDPNWYPSGYWPQNSEKYPNVITPVFGYSSFCLACHGVADSNRTFASLSNVLGKSIRYKQFTGDDAGGGEPDRNVNVPPGFEEYQTNGPPPGNPDARGYDTPFAIALAEPSPAFLAFYDQLGPTSFNEAWHHRFPAQTYDHVFSGAGGPKTFLTSDQCFLCHSTMEYQSNQAEMLVEQTKDGETTKINLSPYGEWSASPMGLAGRDPIFFSQLQSETNNLPQHTQCIENTCLHCHGVMGQRQLAADTPDEADPACDKFFGVAPPEGVPSGRPFRKEIVHQWPGADVNADQKYGALARDGISCTVCHRIADKDLGEESTFTGNFVTDPPDRMNGPYKHVVTAPMRRSIGATPGLGKQTLGSGLCGTCHAVLLPVLTNDGAQAGFAYEQTTYLEWQNSDYGRGRSKVECQGCHMPTHFEGKRLSFKIANTESSDYPPTTHRIPDREIRLTERRRYARHSLHGVNLFLNQMFQQFPLLLGYRQGTLFNIGDTVEAPLLLSERSMIGMAQNETASVRVVSLDTSRDGTLRARVRVTNRAGHDLPSGVGFRRMFLEFVVLDADGGVLWASGRTNGLGAILNGTTDEVLPSEQPVRFPDAPFQPHHQLITRGDQVQIYQELVEDSAGALTTSFLRRFKVVKDNRIRPKGFDPKRYLRSGSPYIRALAETPGRARYDRDYTDRRRTGADEIEYRIDLGRDAARRAKSVRVTLYSQSIPPPYLQQRFRDASRGPQLKDDIGRLQYMASHLNVDASEDGAGRPAIGDWKVFVGQATRNVTAHRRR